MKQTLKEAGYTYVKYYAANNLHCLRNENGKKEWWAANKNHASWGLKWRNTHLEFVTSVEPIHPI